MPPSRSLLPPLPPPPPPEHSTTNSFFWKEHFVTTRDTLLIYGGRWGKSNNMENKKGGFPSKLSKYFQFWNPVFTLGKGGQLCCFPPWSPSLIYIYEAKYEPGDCDPICKPTTLSHLRISSKKTLFMETEVNKIKWMAFEDQSEKYLFIILSTQTASLLTYCAPPSTPNGWPISALPTPWGHFLYEHWTVLFQCVDHLWIVHNV